MTELGEPLDVGAEGVAFLTSSKFLRDVPRTKCAVLVIQSSLVPEVIGIIPETVSVCIKCPDAYLGLAKFSKRLRDMDPISDWDLPHGLDMGVHPSAVVDPSAKIGSGATVGERARVAAGTVVFGNAVIGPEVHLGSSCVIYPGAVIYPRTIIGDRVRVHANAVLGSDGFGYAASPEGPVKIWHLGRLIIGNDVEIGACATIDRGTIRDTIIEDGVKIDNQVQIGHNGYIKSYSTLCGQVGLGGNVTVGRGAILAGKVGVANAVEIGDGAVIGAMSGLSKNVKQGEVLLGKQPPKSRRDWWRQIALINRLPELFERVRNLEHGRAAKMSGNSDVEAGIRYSKIKTPV